MTKRNLWVIVVGVVVVVAVVAAVVLVRVRAGERERDAAARAAASALATGLASGSLASTPLRGTSGARATQDYAAIVEGVGSLRPAAEVGTLTRTDDAATAQVTLTWPTRPAWTYRVRAELAPLDADDPTGTWGARWSPALVQPDLRAGDVLTETRVPAARGGITGRGGVAIVTDTPVVEVGVQPSRATDVPGLVADLVRLLDVDGPALQRRVEAASPDVFVPVITLRRTDYEPLREELRALSGTVLRDATAPLAPTRAFARSLLGGVGPATKEDVDGSQGRIVAGDTVGRSGLQRTHDERLAGTPGLRISRVPADGEPVVLHEQAAVPGRAVATTLDPRVQDAAQAALDAAVAGGRAGNATTSLVAVDVPSGDLLAVANTPADGSDLALTGTYPPGSTFKTVSTLALLAGGLDVQQQVPCPPTATVGGRSFRNSGGESAGSVPFARDFAISCNTAFVGLSRNLDEGALAEAGASVGLGGGWSIGPETFTGSVPREGSAVEVAAATIGQGTVLASPAAMAVVAATIARGSWAPPHLVTDPAPPAPERPAPAPDAAGLATVGDLMRDVATSGTAAALADVPGAPVHAKTGTAEHGTEDPPRTHAWTIGFQGDVAFAVIAEDGASGGGVAVPVVADFLRALAG